VKRRCLAFLAQEAAPTVLDRPGGHSISEQTFPGVPAALQRLQEAP
jgi:hypothetical protein